MDVQKMIEQERRHIVYDAAMSGLFMAALVVDLLTGVGVWSLAMAFLLGRSSKQMADRVRTISWMELVQRQDAVVEQLLAQVESMPLPEQRSKDRVDFV